MVFLQQAERKPVGCGRDEPNLFPTLEDPPEVRRAFFSCDFVGLLKMHNFTKTGSGQT